jgi:hypothetical protein
MYLCVKVLILSLSTIFLMKFEPVPTVWYFYFHFFGIEYSTQYMNIYLLFIYLYYIYLSMYGAEYILHINQEEFEDTKRVFRIRMPKKNRQQNG